MRDKLILFFAVALFGPFLYWLGGGDERTPALACITLVSAILGAGVSTFPWSDK